MKAYRFRLAVLDRVRRIEEDTARQSLAQAVVTRQREVARLDAARLTYLAAGGPPDGPASSMAAWRAGAERAAAHVIHCEQGLAGAEQVLAVARARVVGARRAVTALERLDERQRAAWRQEMARAEQAELDEVGAGRFAPPAGPGGEA